MKSIIYHTHISLRMKSNPRGTSQVGWQCQNMIEYATYKVWQPNKLNPLQCSQ
jgi:hypothetical protein